MTRRIVLCAAFLAAFRFPGGAQTGRPNLAGVWKLSLAKSDFGRFPAPESITRTVIQEGVKLSITNVQKGAQGELTIEFVYTTDGKPMTNKVQGGESKGSAHWAASQLIIESSREVQGATLTQKDVWTLSSDGKTLTVNSHVTLPNGEFDIKQVFEK